MFYVSHLSQEYLHLCISILEFKFFIDNKDVTEELLNLCISILEFKYRKYWNSYCKI